MKVKNNAHVSGNLLCEDIISNQKARLEIGINVNGRDLSIKVDIPLDQWNLFKKNFPNDYNSLTVSGVLSVEKKDGNFQYTINVIDGNSISCFHNILDGFLNESQISFSGNVIVKRKFDFETDSNLVLKKIVLETEGDSPITFEAIALRTIAPYFNDIQEGDSLFLKASFILNKKEGHPPFWKIAHVPQKLEIA